MSVNTRLLRESWELAAPVADKVTAHFYGMLFSRHPQVRELFPAGMDHQRDRLLQVLTQVVLNLDDRDAVTAQLALLGHDHRKYGVRPEHYPVVGRCLLAALRANLGEAWKPEHESAWRAAYELIAQIMIEAAAADRSPAVWAAQVVAHHQPAPDIAVITVQPAQPYPFRAGQHASVQTTRWPKVWRPYSIANAPRADNRLTFHVRVVPAGWVSTTLAHRTQVGDHILLGPARGNLVAPTRPPPHLVCAAGGTGLAPLKAIIEETARAKSRPRVTLIHGVRRRGELYDVADLEQLAARHGRLKLITAISDEPHHTPKQTTVDAVERLDFHDDPEFYLCGPPAMIPATCKLLSQLGVPPHHVHHETDTGRAPAAALPR